MFVPAHRLLLHYSKFNTSTYYCVDASLEKTSDQVEKFPFPICSVDSIAD